jgi:hypothetical protein
VKAGIVKLPTVALALAVLIAPHGLAAGSKRGADLVVIRLDGSNVSGELIAVKPDSVLLLDERGRDVTVDKAKVRSIRVLGKRRTGKGILYGSLIGFSGGAILGVATGKIDNYSSGASSFLLCIPAAFVGGLVGLLVGYTKRDSATMDLAGAPPDVQNAFWDRLRALSRTGQQPRNSALNGAGRSE